MRTLAWDVESHLLKPGLLTPRLVCVSWAERVNGEIQKGVLHREEGLKFMRSALLDDHVTIVAQNFVFDLGVLCATDPSLIPLVFAKVEKHLALDTLLRQQLIDIAKGSLKFQLDDNGNATKSTFTLAALAKRHLGKDLAKEGTWRLRYALLDQVPVSEWPEEAITYSLEDSVTALEVFEHQEQEAGAPIPTSLEQHRAYWALHLASVFGLRTDPKATATLRRKLEEQSIAAHERLKTTDIFKTNRKGEISKSMAAIRRRVEEGFKAQNLPVPLTEKGAIATAKEALVDSKDPDLEILASISETEKLLTAFVPVLEQGTKVPINPRYGLVESGRTSASSPNIQQLPRAGGVRECFVPPTGYVFSFCDYSTLELCTLAQNLLDMFGHSRMAELLKQGQDIHLFFGGRLIGVDYDEAKRRLKEGDKEIKEARQMAKALNFGAPGGLGASTFTEYAKGYGLTITKRDAENLIRQWKQTFPEMAEYFQEISRMTDTGEPLVHRRSGFVRGGVSYTAACNSLFQELSAIGGKQALWLMAKEEYTDRSSPLFGSRTVAWIHDESVLCVPYDSKNPEKASAAAHRQSELMIEGMKKFVPDIPIKADAVLCRRWYKGAEAVFVDGVLVPSKPVSIDGKTEWVADG